MKLRGSLVGPVALMSLVLGGAPGCKKDEQPKPDPAAEAPSMSARVPSRHMPRNGPFNRPDPAVIKDYRLEVCYFGTLSLREARDAYLASLGKDEPSLKKLPMFGPPATAPAPAAPASAAAGAAKPPAAPASASAAAPGTTPQVERRDLFQSRVMHERYARSCSSAVPLKEPAMGDVDAQVATFAPFVVDLAKNITLAEQYYQKEEYKQDNFAKGKDLDKKLREQFAKLDEYSDKLGAALDAWHKDHPPDGSKWEEGEKTARAVIDEGRDVLLAVIHKKADGDAWKASLDKLDKSVAALKTYADAHPADNWSKIMTGPVEGFAKVAKTSKVTKDKTFEPDNYLQLITSYTNLFDARQRAISRSLRPNLGPPGDAPPHPPVPAAPAPEGPK